MNITQEVRIVRLSLIITITASAIGLALLFTTLSYDDSSISIMSSFGEITIRDPKQIHFFTEDMYYQNNDLSFQIFKPDNKWDIRIASEDMSAEELTFLESKGYLDGIYVEQQNNRRFLISVFDIRSENFQLEDYIVNQISLMNFKEDVKIPIKQISQLNDWAIFSIDKGTNNNNSYAEQLLFLKDNHLYMLQYSGESPQTLDSDQKNDFKFIMDSFEVI